MTTTSIFKNFWDILSLFFIMFIFSFFSIPSFAADKNPAVKLPQVEVWKSATCNCCGNWIEHMKANGFNVKVNVLENYYDERAKFLMPAKYASCHIAKVGGYLIEGHIPADDVKKIINEKPKALGLAVPGMPIGSPGMDGPAYNGVKQKFDTLLINNDGGSKVYASHN